MQKILFAILLLSILALPALAQTKAELCPYANRFTIDLSMGETIGVGHVRGYDHGMSLRGDNDVCLDLQARFTRFFSDHWGGFVSFGLYSPDIDPEYYLERLDDYHPAYCHDDPDPAIPYGCWDYYVPSDAFTWLLGPTYRYDYGRWSFRARLGMGQTTFSYDHDLCNRTFVRHDAVYEMNSSTITDCEFELIDLDYVNNRRAKGSQDHKHLAIEPSVQTTFSVGEHFFVSAEVAYRFLMGHYYERMTVTPATCTDNISPHYEPNGKAQSTYTRVSPCDLFSFRLGLGWNIGRNRNVRH